MLNNKRILLVVIIIFAITSFYPAEMQGGEQNAAELVRAVRESENWIHGVQSLYLRFESKWTRTQGQNLTVGAESGEQCPDGCSPAEKLPQLQPSTEGILEYAMDEGRARFLNQESGQGHQLTVWDGKQLISHEKYAAINQENYSLSWTPQGSFDELIAFQTSWPRSQPHSFWWDRKDVEEWLSYYGRPEEYKIAGRCDYRGVDCYKLEFYPKDLLGIIVGQPHQCDAGIENRLKYGYIGEARGLADQFYRWYVGAKDHRLYGIVWLVSGKPHVEHWMLDYKQVADGCRLPMTQGYELYARDNDGRAYVEARRDLKITEVRLNQKLPDDLFKIELKKGVEIIDSRNGREVRYIYEPEPPSLAGKKLPALDNIKFESVSDSSSEGMILLCFWDMEQRPSRNCLIQLSKRAQELKAKNIALVAIQASKIDKASLNEWVKEQGFSFPVGMIESEIEKTRFDWGVKSLPWLILTDKNHVVRSQGFNVNELNDKL
ncbi:MAG: redoxin domain-containing protein [Sedimentisphaerales bacterium]|nr:redoxin domain-containing protein [Sedimentisphaerales bacterium]